MWNPWHVESLACGILGMWNPWHVESLACGTSRYKISSSIIFTRLFLKLLA